MTTIRRLSLAALCLWLPHAASGADSDGFADSRAAQLIVCMTTFEPLFFDPLGGDTEEPIRACNKLLDSGYDANGDIYYFLARLLYYRFRTDDAVGLLEQARAAGSVKGTTALAAFYERGKGGAASSLDYSGAVARAKTLYEEAAEAGDPVAKVALANIYLLNQGEIEPNEVKQLALLRSASEDGYPVANFYLGLHYHFLERGDPDENRAKALEYYEQAARGGVAQAFEELRNLGQPIPRPAPGKIRYPSILNFELALYRSVPLEQVGSHRLPEAI